MANQIKKTSDILDMNNYRIEKLPVRDKSKVEKFLMRIGGPLAIIAFVLLMIFDLPFLTQFDVEALSPKARANFDLIGIKNFISANKAMLALVP